MSRRATPKRFSMYRVTASDVDGIDVGSVLIDKGNLLVMFWDVMDFETGKSSSAVGKRVGLLCPECRVKHRRAAALGHDGEHGPSQPVPTPDDDEVAS